MAAATPTRAQLIQSITQSGFAIEKHFISLQETLRTPIEALNSTAIQSVDNFFMKVLTLWDQIESFQLETNGHLALAISPYDLAGQGQLETLMPKRKVFVSQVISKKQGSGEVRPEYMLPHLILYILRGLTTYYSPQLYVARYDSQLEKFRQQKPPLLAPHGTEVHLFTPHQYWMPESRLVRAKLFEEYTSGGGWKSLGLDGDGFLDVTPQNGFFFAGFIELRSFNQDFHTWPITTNPSVYNSSQPPLKVPNLRGWKDAIAMRLQREKEEALLMGSIALKEESGL
jgi:hypothetical protein